MFRILKLERIYIWMAGFVLILTILNMSQLVKEPRHQERNISAKTFSEMGITEERVKEFLNSKKIFANVFQYFILLGVMAVLTGIWLNLKWIFNRKDNVFLKQPSGHIAVPWDILDIVRAVIIIMFFGHALSIALALIFTIFSIRMPLNSRMILYTFFIDIIAGGVILYFAIVKYKGTIASIGIQLKLFYKNVLAGIIAYIFILPILIIVLLLSVSLWNSFGFKPPPQPVVDIFLQEKRKDIVIFFSIFVAILGPVIEEMFFRGFLYSAIKKHTGVFKAALISAVLFSLLHFNLFSFFPIIVLGLLMAYIYETTNSLISSITVHIIHNSIMVVFVFFVKEMIGHS